MKKLLLKNAFILAIISVVAFIIYSCEKDNPEYKVVVTVKYSGDTLKYVNKATVIIEKNDIRSEGITDEGGQYMAKFDHEAILNISASKDTGQVGFPQIIQGTSNVRLEKDKTIYRTVFLSL